MRLNHIFSLSYSHTLPCAYICIYIHIYIFDEPTTRSMSLKEVKMKSNPNWIMVLFNCINYLCNTQLIRNKRRMKENISHFCGWANKRMNTYIRSKRCNDKFTVVTSPIDIHQIMLMKLLKSSPTTIWSRKKTHPFDLWFIAFTSARSCNFNSRTTKSISFSMF